MSSFLIVILAVVLGFIISCDRPQKDLSAQISVSISGLQTNKSIQPLKLNPNGTIIPANISEIDCLGVLISAPDKNTSQCEIDGSGATFGVHKFGGSRFIGTDSTLNWPVDVPVGNDRRLYLIGFKTEAPVSAVPTAKMICENFFTNKNLENYLSDAYLLATSESLSLQPGVEKNIQMNAVFATTQKLDECEGPAFPDDDNTAGPPTQFRISYQDLPTSSLALSLGLNQCIGVRIDLVDSNGQLANNSTNLPVTIKTQLPEVGTFYQTNSSNMDCQGTYLTPVSGDISYVFNSGKNSLISMFAVNPSSPAASFQVIDPAGVIETVTSRVISQDGSFPVGANYHVYDLYNNRSTFGMTANTPLTVRREECRPAAISLMSATGRQVSQTFSGSTWVPLKIRSFPNMTDVDFYPSYASCMADSGASSDLSLPVGTGTFTFHKIPFAYKVRASRGNSFSIQISNDTTSPGIILINGGELGPANNFWRSAD